MGSIIQDLMKSRLQFIFSLLALNAAVIILIVSLFSGNEPFASPSLSIYEKELNATRISAAQLAAKLEKGERSFLLVQIMNEEDKAYAKPIKRAFYVDSSSFEDRRSYRKYLPFIEVPLIVMADDTKESLHYAKYLKHHGYQNVRYLDGGYKGFVQKIMTKPEENPNAGPEEKKTLDRKMARYYFFAGGDPNLGEAKKAAPATSGGGAPAIGGAEGC